MLRISKLADYGTVIMAVIAKNPDHDWNAKIIAEKTHIRLPTVSKLLKRLTQFGLLSSRRGTKGGYRLAKPAEAIALTDILTAIEGEVSLTECSNHTGSCQVEAFCIMRNNWQIISQKIQQSLSHIYLSQMCNDHTLEKVSENL